VAGGGEVVGGDTEEDGGGAEVVGGSAEEAVGAGVGAKVVVG